MKYEVMFLEFLTGKDLDKQSEKMEVVRETGEDSTNSKKVSREAELKSIDEEVDLDSSSSKDFELVYDKKRRCYVKKRRR